jgi:hypothetical protein
MFNPELCRILSLEFQHEVEILGVPTWRFSPTLKVMASPRVNPDNECFCVEKDKSFCEREGFMMMSGCKEGSPEMFSWPHFYAAELKYADAIDGMKPDQGKHETYLHLEPVIVHSWAPVLC